MSSDMSAEISGPQTGGRKKLRVWDPLVRVFHWSLVLTFAFNALISDPESKLHRQVGYVVLGLVVLRVIWGFIGTRHARFADFPPSLSGSLGQLQDIARGRDHVHIGHTPLGALMIYNLIATIFAIAATGYMMRMDAYWGARWVEELHEGFVVWAEISVLLHILAVISESRRLRINLPRAMVTGIKEVPETMDDI